SMSQDSAPRTINRRPGGREGTRAHAAILLTQEEVTDQDEHGHGGAALPVILVEGDGTAAEGDGTAAEGDTLAAVEGERTAAEVEETAAEGETLAAVEGEGTAAEGEGTAIEGEETAAEGEVTAAEGETLAAVVGDDPTVAVGVSRHSSPTASTISTNSAEDEPQDLITGVKRLRAREAPQANKRNKGEDISICVDCFLAGDKSFADCFVFGSSASVLLHKRNACCARPLPFFYKQIATSAGVKYRQRVVRPADNHANLKEGLPHLRKLDQSKKPMRVILAYHAGSEAMCRKWYLKRLNLPAQDGEAAIPGYMRDLASRPQYADVYIADGAAQYCIYSHITIVIQQALEEQSAFEDQQDADADGNESENFDEPDI
ncbi:hypothetical protein B484DRAFT_473205, partial [Ochromonadaceae sp. CCMP2298]